METRHTLDTTGSAIRSDPNAYIAVVDTAVPVLDPSRPLPPSWESYTDWLVPAWAALLGTDPPEADVHEFLEQHPCLIPGASGDVGPGGHHGPILDGVFSKPEFSGLGRDRVPDFMWVTRSTSLITPICIEVERPGKSWFTLGGTPTAEFTQALDQLTDWKLWFSEPENELIFRKTYVLGDYGHRALEPQFVLIFGRESEFTRAGRHRDPDRLRKKRDYMRRERENFMTFDSLQPKWEASNLLTLQMRSSGPSVLAVPPTFTTGPRTSDVARPLGRLGDSLTKTPLLSGARKDHISQRWEHWRTADSRGIRSSATGE